MEIMDKSAEAASPAKIGDGSGSDNVSLGQAAAILFSKEQASAANPPPAEPQPPPAEETTPEQPADSGSAATDTPATEPAPTEPAEPAPTEPAEAGDDVPSQKPSDKEARIQEKVQRKIDEEVAKRKALEERLARMEADLKKAESEKANPPPPMPKGNLPLAEHTTLESLKAYEAQAKVAKKWARDLLDKPDLGEGVQLGEQLLNRDQIRNILRKAEDALEDAIPARREFLAAREQQSKQAVQVFPFLTDPSTEEYQMAVQAYRANPWLQDLPNADFIVGVQVEGLKALKAKQAASKATTSAPAKPKANLPASKPASDQTATPSATAPVRTSAKTAAQTALAADRDKMRAKGSVSASEAAALLQRTEQLRNLR